MRRPLATSGSVLPAGRAAALECYSGGCSESGSARRTYGGCREPSGTPRVPPVRRESPGRERRRPMREILLAFGRGFIKVLISLLVGAGAGLLALGIAGR